jgi:serine/threonine protein kinase
MALATSDDSNSPDSIRPASPHCADGPDELDETGSTPHCVGAYTILGRLAEGGMGVVYKASQDHPIARTVALKVVRLGMGTKEVIARFEAERQALAIMSHPNIAKVFDAGATDDGRPYFAMEYVPGGQLITTYCDRNRLRVPADQPPLLVSA